MFERFTESARRVLFFARYETSQTGALSIDTEHLLLGLLRAHGPIVGRLLADAQTSSEQVREEAQNRVAFHERTATSVELPFSEETKRILNYTAQEADDLRHSHIGPEHLLLGLLRLPESAAGQILTSHGLRLQTARVTVAAMVAEGPPPTSPRFGSRFVSGSVTVDSTTPPQEAPDPRADTAEILSQIDRIQQLVGQITMALSSPQQATEMLYVLQNELSSLRSRFSQRP